MSNNNKKLLISFNLVLYGSPCVGFGLLPLPRYYASRCEAPQCNDWSWAAKASSYRLGPCWVLSSWEGIQCSCCFKVVFQLCFTLKCIIIYVHMPYISCLEAFICSSVMTHFCLDSTLLLFFPTWNPFLFGLLRIAVEIVWTDFGLLLKYRMHVWIIPGFRIVNHEMHDVKFIVFSH